MKMSSRELGDIVETENMVLFWSGWPSQWFKVKFKAYSHVSKDEPYLLYCCNEQFMMAEKARLFGDRDTLKKILNSDSPSEHKNLGRQVNSFSTETWNKICKSVVVAGNLARFNYDQRSQELLLATGNKCLVEASPKDKIWGIGLAPNDERALDRKNWQGTNWLGESLMQVRQQIIADKSIRH